MSNAKPLFAPGLPKAAGAPLRWAGLTGASQALAIHADYMNIPEGGSVTVNRDYSGQTMSAGEVDSLSMKLMINDR